jgi:hypothetical protein
MTKTFNDFKQDTELIKQICELVGMENYDTHYDIENGDIQLYQNEGKDLFINSKYHIYVCEKQIFLSDYHLQIYSLLMLNGYIPYPSRYNVGDEVWYMKEVGNKKYDAYKDYIVSYKIEDDECSYEVSKCRYRYFNHELFPSESSIREHITKKHSENLIINVV